MFVHAACCPIIYTRITCRSRAAIPIATENAFEVLRLRDGFSISKKMAYIVRNWESVKGEKSKIYKLGKQILDQLLESEQKTLMDDNLRTDTAWIYDPSYDPTSV